MHQFHIYINIRFTFLENVVLLSLPVILVSFEFMNVSIIGTFLFLLGNWCSENTIVRKLGKKVAENQYFSKSCRLQEMFQRIPCSLIKFLIRQVLQTYSEICIFCVLQKKSSRSSWQRLISKRHGNLVMKLIAMWWNSYYSKFGSEIWR